MLFCIIALVTFGDLLQIQYDYNAGSPGSQVSAVHRVVPREIARSCLPLLLLRFAAQLQDVGCVTQCPAQEYDPWHPPFLRCFPSQLNGVLAATFVASITTVGLILMSFFLLVSQLARRCLQTAQCSGRMTADGIVEVT